MVAVSASDGTELVLRSVRRARELGARTVAVTGTAGSPLAEAADHVVVVDLPDREPSPGIRTHQASLVEVRGVPVDRQRAELVAAAEHARDRTDLMDAVAKLVEGAGVPSGRRSCPAPGAGTVPARP